MIKDLMDAAEVAAELRIGVTAVHRLAQRGTLPSEWVGGKRAWRGTTIKRYLADPEAQKRRRGGGGQGKLFIGESEVTRTEMVRSIQAQAPAGFDPIGRRRGESA